MLLKRESEPKLKSKSHALSSPAKTEITFSMDFPLPPPPPFNYYRNDYPPPDAHRLRPPSPSPLHMIPPPLPPRPPPSQFSNFISPDCHRSEPRVPSLLYQHGGNPRFSSEGPRFPDSRPDSWMNQQNHRQGPLSPVHPHNESFRYEGLRNDPNREFLSRGYTGEVFDSYNEFRGHRSNLDQFSRGKPAFDFYLDDRDTNLSSSFQSNLGNRISYNDRDNRSMQSRQLTRLDLSERSSYNSNGAVSDRNMIGKDEEKYFNMSAKKRKAPRKSVLLRIHLGKVESNNFSRSHEEDNFPRAQVDDMVSTGADSHEGKRRKGFGRSERKMEEEREKSPMELDVSFKSNALVAKPIMATPSPVSSPIKRSMRLSSKVEKVDRTDVGAVNLSEEIVKTGSFRELPSHVDDGIRNLNEKVISDEADSTTGCIESLSGCDAIQEDPAEKAIATEIREVDSEAPPCSDALAKSSEIDILGINNNIELSPKLSLLDIKSGNRVASNECAVQSGTRKKRKKKAKRKSVVIPQMDEQDSKLANVLAGGVSDLQEVGAAVRATLASSFQILPSTSIVSGSEDIHACESSENAVPSIADGCSVSSLDNGLVETQIKSVICEIGSLNDMHDHSSDDKPSLRDDPSEKVTDSVNGISVQQDIQVCNDLVGAYSPKDKECGATCPKECNALCSDGRYSKKSRKTLPAEVSSHNAFLEDDFSLDNLAQDKNVTNSYLHSVNTKGVAFPSNMQPEQDSAINLSGAATCSTGGLIDDLGVGTVLQTSSPKDFNKLPDTASVLITVDSPLYNSPSSMVSGLDNFSSQNDNVDLTNFKRKRGSGDDYWCSYPEKSIETGVEHLSSTCSNNGSLASLEKNIACTEAELGSAENMLEKDFPKERPLSVNLTDVGGEKRKVFPSRPPVSSEKCDRHPGESTSKLPTAFPFNSEEADTSLGFRVTPAGSNNPSSLVLTTCSKSPGVLLHGSSTDGEPCKVASFGDDGMGNVSADGAALCADVISVVSENAFKHLNTREDVLLYFNTGVLKNEDMSSKDRTSTKDSVSDSQMMYDSLKPSSVPKYSSTKVKDKMANDHPNDTKIFPSLSENVPKATTKSVPLPNNYVDNNRLEAALSGSFCISESVGLPSGHVDSGKPSSVSRSSTTKVKDEMANDHPNNTKILSSLSENVTKATMKSVPLPNQDVNSIRLETAHLSSFRISESVGLPSVRKRAVTSHVAQPRTWHRNATASQVVAAPKNLRKNGFSLSNLPKNSGLAKDVASVVQSSYIRKGNSLVRKPSPMRSDNLKATGSQKPNVVGLATSEIPGGTTAAPERPETPPLSACVNQFDVTRPNSDVPKGELVSELPRNVSAVATCDPPAYWLKQSILHVDHTNSSSNADCQNRLNEGNSGKKVTYVKRKSNQLVAASSSGAPTFQGKEYIHLSSSDGYYKSRKNQLVRTTSEDDVRQRLVRPDECSKRLVGQKIVQDRSCTNIQSGFLLRKRPLVWTPHGSFSRKQRNLGYFSKVSPYFVPWKKSTYWANLKSSSDSVAKEIPVSSIRKLLLSTKRHTIYKRSISGFSLHRSKVQCAGGRSLKWSKSMERVSKRANEDKKAAVVTPKKRRREQSGPAFSLSVGKSYASRERIFRIGSERYKMDPSGRILQRISDEKALCSEGDAGNDTKKFYMPKRLLIGNDEYVCIGNGNQLIRNPKQRTRVLATEKVRWSLHTARLRLARKKKYCQFFTRFGRCDKDDKKCPYIHDPSKIAVCTKFLRAACSDPDCKLTHKVIPERMQDCSYFVQGLCSNESCPYRHVNVNPKSPVCEGFLRGYCADGNECRKKHTYVCPVFEATGSCEQGPNCKLHHPKNKKKAPERKALNISKNSQGRYFGAAPSYKTETIVPDIVFRTGEDDIFSDNGKFTDYVSLDVGSEAMDQGTECAADPMCDTASQVSSDVAVDDPDELIKPIRILHRRQRLL